MKKYNKYNFQIAKTNHEHHLYKFSRSGDIFLLGETKIDNMIDKLKKNLIES